MGWNKIAYLDMKANHYLQHSEQTYGEAFATTCTIDERFTIIVASQDIPSFLHECA